VGLFILRGQMIIDCFTFFNEVKLLLVRLHYLYEVVDHFVISEGNTTFTGKPKHSYLDQYWEAIPEKISRKIVRATADMANMPDGANPWMRESYQRAVSVDLGCKLSKYPNDVLIISDLDEIPHRDLLITFKRIGLTRLVKLHQVGIKYTPDIYSGDWSCAYASPRSSIDVRQADFIRRSNDLPQVPEAGWHFSYLGSPEQILHKIQAFSHTEFNQPQWANVESIKESIKTRTDLFGRFPGEQNSLYSRDLYPRDLKNLLDLYFPYDEYNLYN